MNSQGITVEKNTHAQRVQMQRVLPTNEGWWRNWHWCRAIMWRGLDMSLAIGILRFDKEYEIKCEYKFSNPLYVL